MIITKVKIVIIAVRREWSDYDRGLLYIVDGKLSRGQSFFWPRYLLFKFSIYNYSLNFSMFYILFCIYDMFHNLKQNRQHPLFEIDTFPHCSDGFKSRNLAMALMNIFIRIVRDFKTERGLEKLSSPTWEKH